MTRYYHIISADVEFQLTRSRGAWRAVVENGGLDRDISTHTLTWSVTRCIWNFCKILYKFQLTRSRGAWQSNFCWKLCQSSISTHTLTWSVTLRRQTLIITFAFQLTRSRGAWPHITQNIERRLRFQLTRSRGAWQMRQSVMIWTIHFNSHAHVERDPSVLPRHNRWLNFNSHAHVERDLYLANKNDG